MAIYAFLCFFEWGHWSLGILTEVGSTAEDFRASVQLVKILIFQGTFLDSAFRRIHWIHDEWFVFSGGSWMIFSSAWIITFSSDFLSKTPQKIQKEVFKFNLALQRQTWNKHLIAYITVFLYHCLACSFYLGMRTSIWMATVLWILGDHLRYSAPEIADALFHLLLRPGLWLGRRHCTFARGSNWSPKWMVTLMTWDPNPFCLLHMARDKGPPPISVTTRTFKTHIFGGMSLLIGCFLDKPSLLGSDTEKKASLSVTEPFVSHHSR